MQYDRREYTCWVIVEPAEDLPGKWVAQCLEFNTLAQADDFEAAFKLVVEATTLTILEDLNSGDDPLERRAPDEDWERLRFILESDSSLGSYDDARKDLENKKGRRVLLAAQFMLGFRDAFARSTTSLRALPTVSLKPLRARPSELRVHA